MTTRDELQRLMDEHDSKYGAPEKLSDKWRREATEAEAERKAERDAKLTEYEAARLRAELDGKLADVRAELTDLVASERASLIELIGQVSFLAGVIDKIGDKIDESVGGLRAEMNMQRAVDKADNVTELPAFLRKKS